MKHPDDYYIYPADYTTVEAEIKDMIGLKLPHLNLDGIVATKTGVCPINKFWGFLPYF